MVPLGLKVTSNMLQAKFHQLFGKAPQWMVRAPGRVNLIGEHTDYNDGFVLPMAVERYTTIAAAPNESQCVKLHSAAKAETVAIDVSKPIEPEPDGRWSNYPKGVLAKFLRLDDGIRGFDALIESTVPLGGGLSSSASLEVAMATLLEVMSGRVLPPAEKARLCQQAEHEYAGVPCGVMDQYASILGRAGDLLLLDCRSLEPRWIAWPDPSVAVLIINTGVKHELASSEYSRRRAQCEAACQALQVTSLRDVLPPQLLERRSVLDPLLFRRARHVITEIARTERAAALIEVPDWIGVGELMYASHESLRDDYEVSCEELEILVRIVREYGPPGGVYGCRMTGGGFGGCAVALIKTEAIEATLPQIRSKYESRTGIEPALFVSRPAAGAMQFEET
jgi:galactokinase